MALRRSKRKIANDTQHRTKRLARGRDVLSHHSESGILDVTPGGEYVGLVERNRRSSPLFRLPPEIRDMIWKEVLGNNTVKPKTWERRTFFATNTGDKNDFALLRVCRQIYSEAALVPYQENVFQSDISQDYEFCKFTKALSKIKMPLRQHIQRLDVPYESIAAFHIPFVHEFHNLPQITLFLQGRAQQNTLKFFSSRSTMSPPLLVSQLKRDHPNVHIRFRLYCITWLTEKWIDRFCGYGRFPFEWVSQVEGAGDI